MSDPLQRIRDLMARATSDNENEARTSALLAVRLMQKHDIQLLTLDDLSVLKSRARVDPAPAQPVEDFFVPNRSKPGRKVRDLNGVDWQFYEAGAGGGRCIFCNIPVVRGVSCYSGDPGILHMPCWTSRQAGNLPPGTARASRVTPVAPAPPPPVDESKAVDEIFDIISKMPR